MWKNLAIAIKKEYFLNEWNIFEVVERVFFEKTVINTGWINGAVSIIKRCRGKPINFG